MVADVRGPDTMKTAPTRAKFSMAQRKAEKLLQLVGLVVEVLHEGFQIGGGGDQRVAIGHLHDLVALVQRAPKHKDNGGNVAAQMAGAILAQHPGQRRDQGAKAVIARALFSV